MPRGICGRITFKSNRKQPLFSPPPANPAAAAATMHNGCPFLSRALVHGVGRGDAGQPRFTEQGIQKGRMVVRRQRERKGLFGAEG